MRRIILTLVGLAAFLVIGGLMLRDARLLWVQTLNTICLLAILGATLTAVYSDRWWRRFAGGFAVFAAGYFLLFNSIALNTLQPMLATTQSLEKLRPHLAKEPPPAPAARFSVINLTTNSLALESNSLFQFTGMSPTLKTDNFLSIGHGLYTLALGVLGGGAALWAGGRCGDTERRQRPTATTSDGD